EREAPADQQDALPQRKGAVEQGATEHLVHGVVSPDVLPQRQKRARRVEEASRVQPARMGKDALLRMQSVRQGVEHLRRHYKAIQRDRRQGGAGSSDAVLAADTTACVHGEPPRVALLMNAPEQVNV